METQMQNTGWIKNGEMFVTVDEFDQLWLHKATSSWHGLGNFDALRRNPDVETGWETKTIVPSMVRGLYRLANG